MKKVFTAFLHKEKKFATVMFLFYDGIDIVVEYCGNPYIAVLDKEKNYYIVDNKYGLYRI